MLSNYMYASGWIPKDKWIEPKAYTEDMAPPPSAK